jgi:hypothetical protein
MVRLVKRVAEKVASENRKQEERRSEERFARVERWGNTMGKFNPLRTRTIRTCDR